MEIAELILKYVQVFIWPAVVLSVILAYRKHISRFLQRLTEETEEINSTLLGLSARFRKELTDLSKSVDSGGSDTKAALRARVASFAEEQFRVLCSYFYTQPLSVRVKVAEEVAELSGSLTIEQVLGYAESPLPGERVGAGVALGEHLKRNTSLAQDHRVYDAFRKGLCDSYSRVRYRYVEALYSSRDLVATFTNYLSDIAKTDVNDEVRREAREVLHSVDS